MYGADPAQGPETGHEYRELIGGPLDGRLVDVTGWSPMDVAEGSCLITKASAWPGGRACYAPRGGDPEAPWVWQGDIP
ncbi:hypothetical protein ACH4VR_29760 [Streptomyces sp. NPDC020883]|uniref:hypothetical protein n=1 Tax=Streptomyces sp. NPDC020883 TaxID=3365099 RepID=UPI0037AC3DD6